MGHLVPSVEMPLGPESQAVHARLALDTSFQNEERACEWLSPPMKVAVSGAPAGACTSRRSPALTEKEGADVLLARPAVSRFPGLLEIHQGRCLATFRG